MSMSFEEILKEQAIEDLREEEVMKQATKNKCIYLFVEGDSEERTFPYLISEAGFDLEKNGIIIANYNGYGNLRHALRLLNKTLSNNRPVIVTIDNDVDGHKTIKKISDEDYLTKLIHIFTIPVENKVKYDNGHKGGSFEEMFNVEHFIDCCFSEVIMEKELINLKSKFYRDFDKKKPWYNQVRKFCALNEYTEFADKKVTLAEYLMEECNSIPKTILKLVDLIKEVRDKYPVKHPYNIELPKVQGLTYFPKEEK